MFPESRPNREIRGYVHIPPDWVSNEATFFITIMCTAGGEDQLTRGDFPASLFSSVSHYRENNRWWPEFLLLMPDHLHALVSFSWDPKQGMNSVVRDWKRYTARAFGIEWQRDFFDHRIRNDEDHLEKWRYIRDNPVRAGIVDEPTQWPHAWFPDRIGW